MALVALFLGEKWQFLGRIWAASLKQKTQGKNTGAFSLQGRAVTTRSCSGEKRRAKTGSSNMPFHCWR
jgi:hypothetical protein